MGKRSPCSQLQSWVLMTLNPSAHGIKGGIAKLISFKTLASLQVSGNKFCSEHMLALGWHTADLLPFLFVRNLPWQRQLIVHWIFRFFLVGYRSIEGSGCLLGITFPSLQITGSMVWCCPWHGSNHAIMSCLGQGTKVIFTFHLDAQREGRATTWEKFGM